MATRLKQLGRTQSGLVRALGLPHPRIYEIIRGSRRVQVDELSKLASYLEMTEQRLVSLLRDEDAETNQTNIDQTAPDSSHTPDLEEALADKDAESFSKQFRQRLIEIREGLGWSQARMASALGVPYANYKKYETRSTAPMYFM